MRFRDRHVGKTKQDVLNEIARLLHAGGRYTTSTGSTEPKAALEAVVVAFGLPIDLRATKPALAEAIAGAGGVPWDSTCDSRSSPSGGGSTVTLEGLCRVLAAVEHLGRQAR